MRGCEEGRPLAAKIRRTATSFPASAARPYTVSVGIATRPPCWRTFTARSKVADSLGEGTTPSLTPTGSGRKSRSQMIEVERLTKYYGAHAAIRDLTFQISKGEVIGFLGL